jgi:phenylalanyl-tRNA synthetase beta chain
MKASHQWLRTLVPALPDDPGELAARFTAAGLEVEAMHAYGAGSETCVVARVVSAKPHPSKSGLRLVTVDRGGASQEVVCGAPNVPDPGGLVVLAPLGTYLPAKGMTIERRAIGGVTSEGMLCSEQELGLGDDGDGIMILPAGIAAPGALLTEAIPGARDTIFEIGLTPNRPDGLGHIGLAREAAALFGVPFAMPLPGAPARTSSEKLESLVSVEIQDPERCPHYAAAVLVGATIGPSPAWMRYRLASLGVRAISSAVDITNWVTLEYGRPMHAFDLDRVTGAKIIVRRAKDGEKLRTLDGTLRALSPDDLVICDGGGPLALAGVMGGGDSEISATTTRVLLECAYFEPRGVRRSARRHAMHTEASHRFERGVDHGSTEGAILRASSLMSEIAGAAAVPGVTMVVARPIANGVARLRAARLEQLLGVAVPASESRAILQRLGLVRRGESRDGADEYELPTHRPDLAREEDLIEEVARVRGYDKIPTVLPAIRPTREESARDDIAKRVRHAAVELGLSEAITPSFVSPSELEALGAPASTVILANPLNELQSVMRTSMLPGLLRAVSNARRHGERDVRLFGVGPVFLAGEGGASGDAKLPEERMSFAAVLSGDRDAHLARAQGVDVYDGKGLALGLVVRLARRAAETRALSDGERPKHLHPRAAAAVSVEGREVGRIGLLHPDVADALGVGGPAGAADVIVVEIDLAALDALGLKTPQFAGIPRFPAATRDVALVVHDDIAAGAVEAAVRDAAGVLAEEVRLFDRFAGGAIPKGHASLAFHVVYRAADRTLTDDEVDRQHAKVVAEVGTRFGATLR